jgi:hypothetical protein
MRGTIYARFSSDPQDLRSIADQVDHGDGQSSTSVL